MAYKKVLLVLPMLFVICTYNVLAQKKVEYKFGKVQADEFSITASGADSAASAIKLFDIGNCYFELSPVSKSFVYVFERHIRYKIINKNGYDYANHAIGLYKSDSQSKETLDYMNAATYNMVDGVMKTDKIDKDAKFTEEVNKNVIQKKFTLPNVKEGSIIEFKYKIKSDFIFNLRGWSFQSDIPTRWSEFTVTIPEYFDYKFNKSGYYDIAHALHESVHANYVVGLQSSAVRDRFAAENMPALKDEPFISSLDDYRPSIDFELRSTNFPGQFFVDHTGSWPKIISAILKDENFGGYLEKGGYAKNNLKSIIKAENDSLANAKAIFKYVKDNLKWNEKYNYYSSETNPKTIFEKKTGNSADLNLVLVNFLKEAKFNVYPVLISTRANGKHPGYPVISKFDNVVAAIEIGGQLYFLDATIKDMPFGMINYQNLNHEGFLINVSEKEGRWVSTETSFGDESMHVYNLVLDKELKLTGTLTNYFNGYAGLSTRNSYRNAINEEDYIKNLKKNKTGLELSNFKMLNLDSLDERLIVSMDVEIEDNVEEAGDLVYFTPLLFERTKENPLKHEERLFPVDFAHPIQENCRVVVNFPEDYQIDKLPKGGVFKLPEDVGQFSISYLIEGQTLLIKSVININKSMYSPEEYFYLKELFAAIVEKQAEKIVFKKKV
jgi:L-amino acid N-acyltransferase YncA